MIIVVVGMAFEARIAAASGLPVVCSGDGKDLPERLDRAIADGCRGLISFGVAGGLAPDLKPGSCVVGSEILAEGARMATHAGWSQALLRALPGAVHAPIIGVSEPVAHPDRKRDLHVGTGAAAVDMESHVVAKAAIAHGLPVAAIRVVTDPAKRAIPPSALVGLKPDGTADVGAIVRSLARNPRELPALLRTALDARAARSVLLRSREMLGPGFGLLDLGKLDLDVA